jgi:hypothetical protein
LDSLAEPKSRNFEFIAALFMQRLYEKQWNVPAMIGFYMKPKWHELLLKTDNPSPDLLMDALKNGIDEHRPTDFVIAAYDETAYQEFQLKRFGMKESNTEALIDYLNALKKRYVPNDGACLIAITDFSLIDFPKVNRQVEKKNFPFAELLFMGVVADKLLVAGILPNEGFSAFDLSVVVAD